MVKMELWITLGRFKFINLLLSSETLPEPATVRTATTRNRINLGE